MNAILFVIAIGFLDAFIKGKLRARKSWDETPDFWKSGRGPYEPILFAIALTLAGLAMFAFYDFWLNRILFAVRLLLLGFCGLESLLSWWWLKPLGIKQKAHWKQGSPPAGWFDYPDHAPWMNPYAIPLLFSKLLEPNTKCTSRGGILLGSSIAAVISIALDFFDKIKVP